MPFFKKPTIESLLPATIIILILVLVAGGSWWLFGGGRDNLSLNPSPSPGEGKEKEVLSPGAGERLGERSTYDSPDEPFTFQYPQKFNVTELPIEGGPASPEGGQGGGKRILVESAEPKKGFEITILPFDESGPLTEERIKQDLPDMLMENVRNITVGSPSTGSGTNYSLSEQGESKGISALSFNSTDENIGPTFEIWFVAGGYLYQALTYPEFGEEMQQILQTWKFK